MPIHPITNRSVMCWHVGRLNDFLIDEVVAMGGVVATPLTLHATMKADPGVIEVGGQAYFDALRAAAL